jgi:hypothetical protein
MTPTPPWRAPLVLAGLIGLAAIVALVVAFLVLTGDNAPLPTTAAPAASAPPLDTVPTTAAPAVPPAPTTAAAVPTVSVTTASVPAVPVPTATTP